MRSRISPVVRRLADEHQIDLANVRGTGIGGRITRKDVLAAIDSPNVPVRSTGLHLTTRKAANAGRSCDRLE